MKEDFAEEGNSRNIKVIKYLNWYHNSLETLFNSLLPSGVFTNYHTYSG